MGAQLAPCSSFAEYGYTNFVLIFFMQSSAQRCLLFVRLVCTRSFRHVTSATRRRLPRTLTLTLCNPHGHGGRRDQNARHVSSSTEHRHCQEALSMRPLGQLRQTTCWRAHQQRQLASRPSGVRMCCKAAISDDVQAYIADCFSLLRAYKSMCQQLGPSATQHVRALTSPSQRALPAPARREALQAAAGAAAVNMTQLAELVSLRQRLLHEIPAVQASVAQVRAEQGIKQPRRAPITATNCNQAATASAPAAASQWVRAKQYKSHHHEEQTEQANPDQPSDAPPSPNASWIDRLGFSDMVRTKQTAGNAIVVDSIGAQAPQVQQPIVSQQVSSTDTASTLAVLPMVQQGQQQLQKMVQGSGPCADVTQHAGPAQHQQSSVVETAASQPLSTTSCVQVGAAPEAHSTAAQVSAADQTVPEVPSAAPARLRSALMAAAKYKSVKTPSTSSMTHSSSQAINDSSLLPAPPSQYAGKDTTTTVEYGNMSDVYAHSRNRGNPDEAALLVCP